MASCRSASLRPESFLFRLTQKEEKRKGEFSLFRQSSSLLGPDPGAPPPPGDAAPHSQLDTSAAPPLVEEEAQLVEQLRKVSLPRRGWAATLLAATVAASKVAAAVPCY